MIEFFNTIILGVVEGVTEFLPISSTAHLIIAEYFLGAKTDAFNVIIQFGAVMAVILIYWRRLMDLFLHFREPQSLDYLKKILGALILTIIGCLIAKFLGFQLPVQLWPIVSALWLGALVIFIVEKRFSPKVHSSKVTWSIVFWVALAQILAAVFPGTSRSGATIIAAMLCGLSRVAATEFSFLLSIPTMFAASLYMGKEAYDAGLFVPEALGDLALGFFVSMVTAFIAVKWLIRYVQSNTFIPFAWYRIVLGVVIAIVLWKEGHVPPDLQHNQTIKQMPVKKSN